MELEMDLENRLVSTEYLLEDESYEAWDAVE